MAKGNIVKLLLALATGAPIAGDAARPPRRSVTRLGVEFRIGVDGLA
ncbi:MAG TPA: hypothetical protein VG651_10295 [Stellaceae bacterium]|nr:hypothetical protein [Stellaceae bacterium]